MVFVVLEGGKELMRFIRVDEVDEGL